MANAAVVILNWNGADHLRRFLPSVLSNTPAGVGVWVADNGSTDGSAGMLAEEFPAVEVIRLDRNYGYAEGYNLALADRRLDGVDYAILLNSDVETPPGWLGPLTRALDSDPRLAAVSPKILSYTNRQSFEYAGASGGFIDILGYPFCRGRILSTVQLDAGQYDTPREVFWTSGACMAVRLGLFRKLGGFDGDFFAHMEEIDFCWRAGLAGWKSAVVPASHVYHLGGGTLSPDSPCKLYLNYRNNLCMLYKNLPTCGRRTIIPLRMLSDGLSALVYLFTLRGRAFRAIWDAHRDYRKQKPSLRARRAATTAGASKPFKEMIGVYRGSIVMRYILGKRKFGDIL
ncbi:MAG: glycosyltransferase family 2 protein [Alistipes sp.]|nr:glycosyltransferase family 2 protein [Alistipes sp.]